jgi:hypothetical protein
MSEERILSLFTDHGWLVEATERGLIWIRIGETKHLFSASQIVRLCKELLQFAVDASDILDPIPEPIEKEVDESTFWHEFSKPDVTLASLGIELKEDPLDQFRENAA